jgi:hypothetical protein
VYDDSIHGYGMEPISHSMAEHQYQISTNGVIVCVLLISSVLIHSAYVKIFETRPMLDKHKLPRIASQAHHYQHGNLEAELAEPFIRGQSFMMHKSSCAA